jgi:hypothetical protein
LLTRQFDGGDPGPIALISRSLGRISSAIFGWAVVALFGQTDPAEKTMLSALVGAAAAWPVLLLGIAMPKIAVFALGFVPLPDWVPRWTVRLVWIGLAATIPLAVGLTMAMRRPRPRALEGEPSRRAGVGLQSDCCAASRPRSASPRHFSSCS